MKGTLFVMCLTNVVQFGHDATDDQNAKATVSA